MDPEHESSLLYNDGVRFGSWGMSIYSISCSIYSFNIQALNNYFGMYLVMKKKSERRFLFLFIINKRY